ncbi:MAG: oxidase [Bergeyella zoohelcum]|nr:oxidase [Bergeyella zoohelcum]
MNFAPRINEMTDLVFTSDLEFENGDFVLKESQNQQVQHIIIAQKGEYKEFPELGVGIEQMLNTEEPTEFLIEAKKNLEYDGLKVKNIAFTENGTIKIEAK